MEEDWQGTSDFMPEEIGKLENIFTFQVFWIFFPPWYDKEHNLD